MRIYHTHRFGVDCRSDQMPPRGSRGPCPSVRRRTPPWCSRRRAWFRLRRFPTRRPRARCAVRPHRHWFASVVPPLTAYSIITLTLTLVLACVTLGTLHHRRATARRMLTMTQFRPESSSLLLLEAPSGSQRAEARLSRE
ncbi:hypothetical protein [Nesterenkonia pannonica]|uniref:hypothetical protein n=1 Tax=Nesterenkonia pannonica TaxID=1548602 RepID=UPI00216435DA|nr:hypothetical protein [Nesterenkonia pannonica]